MPGQADVPLHPAADPGVADGQVAGLKDGIAKEQLAAGRFMPQRPQPPAHFEEKGGAQRLVLQHRRAERTRAPCAVILVLHQVRQAPARAAIAEILPFRLGDRVVQRHAGMQVAGCVQHGQGIVRAQVGGGQDLGFESKGTHTWLHNHR